MTCICKDKLSPYLILYVDNPQGYQNYDWCINTGTLIGFDQDDASRLIAHHKGQPRYVWAFTVGEVHRLVEYEQGNNRRQPLHRILNEDAEIIHECQVPETTEQVQQILLERYNRRYGIINGGSSANT